MKILFFFFLTISISSYAQTNIVALKSHSGNLKNLHLEKDNFGNPPPRIVRLKYLYDSCFVFTYQEFGSNYEHTDTNCSGSYIDLIYYNEDSLSYCFGYNNAEIEGFEHFPRTKDEYDKKPTRALKGSLNRIKWMFIFLVPIGVYALSKKKK